MIIKELIKDTKYQQLINVIKNKQPLPPILAEYKKVFKNLEIKLFQEGKIIIHNGTIIVIPDH